MSRASQSLTSGSGASTSRTLISSSTSPWSSTPLGSHRPSMSSLAELALSDQPLDAETSLLDLIKPDVQTYVLQHGASTRVAAHSSRMRVGTHPTGADAELPAAQFGRRRHRTPSTCPPQHRDLRNTKDSTEAVTSIGALAQDYLSDGRIDFTSPINAASIQSHHSSTAALHASGGGRTAKVAAREQSVASLAHTPATSGSNTSRSSKQLHATSSSSHLHFSHSAKLYPHTAVDMHDEYPGQVDRWPAGQSRAVHPLREFEDPLLAAKPRLLSDLDQYVHSELHALQLSDRDPPSQARLQLYREVFLRFIDEFHTYKPILARIQREYDDYLQSIESKLHVITGLQRKVATMDEETHRQLDTADARWRVRERELTQRAEQLSGEVTSLQSQLSTLTATHATTCTELQSLQTTHQSLLVSHDTLKKALTRYGSEKSTVWEEKVAEVDLNRKLNAQITELQRHQSALLQEMALIRTHTNSMQTMNPTEFTRLQTENDELRLAVQEQTLKYQGRSAEYFQLLNQHEAAVKEQQDLAPFKEAYERLRNSSTPRPQWRRLLGKQYLPDSCNLDVQSSESLIDELCVEIDRLRASLHNWELKYPSEDEVAQLETELKDGGVKREASKFIRVRGSGLDVPAYLRWGSKPGIKIRNKNINKRETEIFIKEVWAAKLHTPDAEGGEEYRRMSLEEFLFVFLRKKFGFQEAIASYAYSILDSLERFRFDGDCDLFLEILNRNLSELVYVDQFAMLDGLKLELERVDAEYHKGRLKGRLPRKMMLDVLARYFHTKREIDLRKMNRAFFVNDRSEMVAYNSLFEEDREGNQGPFVELIRDQHLAEIREFTSQLHQKLVDKAARYDGALRPPQIREIILVLDPTKPPKEVDAYLREGFDKPVAEIGDEDTIDPEIFFTQLSRRLLKRTGPPPEKEDVQRRGSSLYRSSSQSGTGTNASGSPVTLSRAHSLSPTAYAGDADEKLNDPSPPSNSLQPPPSTTVRRVSSRSPSHELTPTKKPVFSDLARRISMVGPRFAGVVLAAAAAKDADDSKNKERVMLHRPEIARVISIEVSAPSNPNSSPPTPVPASSTINSPLLRDQSRRSLTRSPHSNLDSRSPSAHRSPGGAGLPERLQSQQLSRETARSQWEADQSAAAQLEASKGATVLPMRREVDPDEGDVDVDRRGSGSGLLSRDEESPEEALVDSRLASPTETLTPPPPRHISFQTMSAPTSQPFEHAHAPATHDGANATRRLAPSKPLIARVSSMPTPIDAAAARSASSVSLRSDSSVTGRDSVASSTAIPASPIFSPTTTAVVATRKSIRLSMRRSGGLISMLAHMKETDHDSE